MLLTCSTTLEQGQMAHCFLISAVILDPGKVTIPPYVNLLTLHVAPHVLRSWQERGLFAVNGVPVSGKHSGPHI